jgi:hypothetical protein
MKTSHTAFTTARAVVALIGLISLSSIAFADVRCKGNLISEGSSASEVISNCGSPTSSSGTILGDDSLTYTNKDSAGVTYTIILGTNGKVQRIEESKHWSE